MQGDLRKMFGEFKFGFIGAFLRSRAKRDSLLLWRRWHGVAVTDEENGQKTPYGSKEKLGAYPINIFSPFSSSTAIAVGRLSSQVQHFLETKSSGER